jgi:hypothetical protein
LSSVIFAVIEHMNTTTIPAIRKRAATKVILGVAGCTGVAGLFTALAFAGYMPGNPFMLIPAAIPFVYACVGSVELLTGRPYQQLGDAWMNLKGWQRGVIGTLIVLLSGILIFAVMSVLAFLL